MNVLAIVNNHLLPDKYVRNKETVNIAGNPVNIGVISIEEPNFDISNSQNDDFILVKVEAFSCNYRDKALIVKKAIQMRDLKEEADPIGYFGSDFVGRITAIGSGVKNLSIGMRVIPNCYYPYQEYEEIPTGVVTNEASRGWLKLHKSKVLPIPIEMSDEIAAAFSIGAQTSTSIIDRSFIKTKDKVLVTSARSNTSLFVIRTLTSLGNDVTALTTSEWAKEELEFIYPAKIFNIERGLKDWGQYNLGKFDVVIDPFYDLNLLNSIPLLNYNGRYITCGFKNQHNSFKEDIDDNRKNKFNQLLIQIMINNLYIIGNCIGTTEHLKQAIDNFDNGRLPIMINSSMDVYQGLEFLNQTYNSKNRFGKTIMVYKTK